MVVAAAAAPAAVLAADGRAGAAQAGAADGRAGGLGEVEAAGRPHFLSMRQHVPQYLSGTPHTHDAIAHDDLRCELLGAQSRQAKEAVPSFLERPRPVWPECVVCVCGSLLAAAGSGGAPGRMCVHNHILFCSRLYECDSVAS